MNVLASNQQAGGAMDSCVERKVSPITNTYVACVSLVGIPVPLIGCASHKLNIGCSTIDFKWAFKFGR